MLDAYIIDRIRQERDRSQRRNSQIPLHIDELPAERRPAPKPEPRHDDPERGSIVVDFHL